MKENDISHRQKSLKSPIPSFGNYGYLLFLDFASKVLK